MAPVRSLTPGSHRLIYSLYTLISTHFRPPRHVLTKRAEDHHKPAFIVFAALIPILVLLSGVFAGLTLGYMSLDQTQLNVLCLSGTPEQRKYANKILPIRKNGHLLLVTLLLANMIVNESLPIISDPVLGGGVQSVVVSTVLIIIFSEIIPQSLFTRYGLFLGAKAAPFTQFLIYALGIIAWPVAKLLEFVLGEHHGLIYRRAELKELIAMHSASQQHGGDLKVDTVTIIGATLDLQEKVVRDAMTPIDDVFMLSIEARLDYDLLKRVVATGHSRIPVYEEIDAPVSVRVADGVGKPATPKKVKKILGILLVKQLVLLDPKDAIPLRTVPLNTVPFVPNNQSLLGILDKFQEGRSHIAIVSRFSVEKAHSVKKAVKRGLTQRLREKVGLSDSSDSESDSEEEGTKKGSASGSAKGGPAEESESAGEDGGVVVKDFAADPEVGVPVSILPARQRSTFQMSNLEQSMPADAVMDKADASGVLEGLEPSVMPLGIITLEDVLEELIGEEIWDETDAAGKKGTYVRHHRHHHHAHSHSHSPHVPPAPGPAEKGLALPSTASAGIRGLTGNFLRSRSVPPSQRAAPDDKAASDPQTPSVAPEPLPSILKDGAEAATPQPEPATVEFASPPVPTPAGAGAARQMPVRSGSLPADGPLPVEAVLRAGVGAGRRGRVGTPGTVTRGKFKSSPIGDVGGAPAAGASTVPVAGNEPNEVPSTPAAVAAAIPIAESGPRTTGDEDVALAEQKDTL